MDVVEKRSYQIEVGLSAEDMKRLAWGDHMLQQREIGIAEKLTVRAFSDEYQRDRLVLQKERVPAILTYAKQLYPPYVSDEYFKIASKDREVRNKIYAKGIGNGDVDIYMTEITAMAINPNGIIEVNAKIPQLMKQFPNNNVKMFVKIPF